MIQGKRFDDAADMIHKLLCDNSTHTLLKPHLGALLQRPVQGLIIELEKGQWKLYTDLEKVVSHVLQQ
jgi:hypothetical protein